MSMKSLLIGSAAALVAVSGARAADAVGVAAPVRVCDTFGVGFTLLRYADTWLVSWQSSVLGGTSALGTAEPMTRAEFDDRTS